MAIDKFINTCWRLILLSNASILVVGCALFAAPQLEVPVVDGHIGACSATLTVRDASSKPIYNAKINVIVRYGFLSLRKIGLQVGTNSDGRARVAGLPERPKKSLEFVITKG